MPPKRKSKAPAKSAASKDKNSALNDQKNGNHDEPHEEPAPITGKRRRSKDSAQASAPEPAHAETEASSKEPTSSKSVTTLVDRKNKLEELKRRRIEAEQGNRRDRNLEFQRSKENPKAAVRAERKKEEALKLLEKQEALDRGEDHERKQFWKYSAESVEAWNKKMKEKEERANQGFTDHTQSAHRKYSKLMADFKPDMSAYRKKELEAIERALRNGDDPSSIVAQVNSLEYASIDDKPSKEAIERLVQDVKKQIHVRDTRSRDRKEVTDDISWINEKNRVFNQKIARFYNKYTKEIRDNLERGTAL